MMKFLCCFFLFISWALSSQNVISGKLQDINQKSVVGASVTLSDVDTELVFAYSITDIEGRYSISYSHFSDSIQLNIRALGYEQLSKIIENKSQINNFILTEQEFQLKEVIIKAPPITRRGDTINYNVSAFSNEIDRSIGDVLKRMPGIEVRNDGTILYEGTPINKYYIEGLDLLEGRYRLANENLPHKEVAKVQILENHQPIKILDSLVFSERAALNIQLKNDHILTGQAKVGTGFSPLLWDTNLTPMLFSKTRQAIFSYQANNSGQVASSQIKSLINEGLFESKLEKQDLLYIQQPTTPRFPETRWIDNNSHLLTANILQKLNRDFELRLNVSYVNDYQQQNGYTRTRFFTPTDTISLFESQYNRLFFSSLNTNLTIQRNTKKNFFKNEMDFQSFWDGMQGYISNENTYLSQILSNPHFKLSNRLQSVFPIGKQLVTLDSYMGIAQTPQNLLVSPGTFEELLNNGLPYSELTQETNLGTFYTDNAISFTKGLGHFSIVSKVGVQIEARNFESKLYANDFEAIDNQYLNDLSWFNSKSYLSFSTRFRSRNWRVNLLTPLSFHTYRIKDITLLRGQDLNRLTFEPNLSVARDFGNYWRVRSSIGLSNSFGDIHQLHYGYILRNYRSLQRIDSPLLEGFNTSFSSMLSYRNPIKSFFGNITYNFNHSLNNLLYENEILPEGTIELRAISQDNIRRSHNFSGRLSKYISNIGSSITLQTSYTIQNFQMLLNGITSDIENHSQQIGGKIESDLSKWLTTEYSTSFLFLNNRIQDQQNRKVKQQSHKLDVNLHVTKKQFVGLRFEYLESDLFTNKDKIIFSDLIYRYSLNNKNIDFDLTWTNILNNVDYNNINISEFTYVETNFRLRPSQIMLTVRFSL